MTLPADLVDAGIIMKTHGYLGTFRVNCFFAFDLLQIKEPIFVIIDQKPVPFFIESLDIISDNEALLKLEDIDSKEEAVKLNGKIIRLSRSILPEQITLEGEHFPAVMGYHLINSADQSCPGTITHITIQDKQTYLLIDPGSRKKSMIPFHEDLIVSVDHERKELVMDLPEGLTNL